MLTDLKTIATMLENGKSLILAGDERMLRQLPKGQWIGGTIPYFMSESGGVTTQDGIYVSELPSVATSVRIGVYDAHTLPSIASTTPDDGYTVLIIPAFSKVHEQYALEARTYEDMFLRVVAGWISGVHLNELGKASPLVFDGTTGNAYDDCGVAIHVRLPSNLQAILGIVNIFEPGSGDDIEFEASGFQAKTCIVNGKQRGIVEYIETAHLDTRLPLVASYMGTHVNVSIQSLESGVAKFYAPVFKDVKYRWAKPVGAYPSEFAAAIPTKLDPPVFSCNCILNYLYGELENHRTGALTGPMTFGEIGYQLLNQTLVYVSLVPQSGT
jgi:hypothetical protein